ncbi:protein RRNAD1-like [Chelonus insularis]|uniref:protein RRNAD1-like n=1 Tax=Chelonus insularis TaxID=460826 RepID=UPI0015897DC2|nr:protein RRNAD1-like [Chelonus insularis]
MKCTLEEANVYFQESIHLFHEFQWLFQHPVIEILIHNYFKSFPQDWLEALKNLSTEELNDFANGKLMKDNWPKTLELFIKKCKKLNKLPPAPQLSNPQLPKSFLSGLSLKKQHEIFYLSQVVHQKCVTNGIRIIVDFGAGLGYICQLLNYLYDYTVIGLESNENNVKIAKKRQTELYSQSIGSVKFIHIKVNKDCEDEIRSFIRICKYSQCNYNFCLIGLHACADLSVNACKLFSKMDEAKVLIIVSCCYHKLQIDEKNKFINFPLSKMLKNILDNHESHIQKVFGKTFLRLACQEPASRWENMSKITHEHHAFHVLARAVIELFIYENNISLTKCVQKATRKTQCSSFHQYLLDTLNRYKFNNIKVFDNEQLKEKLLRLWELHKDKMEDVEIYTALQCLLQMSAESLVLYDRCCWLLENNYSTEIVTILNNKISPRCYAIISNKIN